jgi:membrane-bound lytic murein transglycosylase MltF
MIFSVVIVLAIFLFSESSEGKPVNSTSNNFDELFQKYAIKYNLDWRMLKSIAIIESSLGRAPSVAHGIKNPTDVENSKSSDGKSWGLMQVTLPTARDYDSNATAERLNSPEYSINLASQYLRTLFSIFKGDVKIIEKVVKSYNQGQGNTLKGKTYADGYWIKYQNAYKTLI